MVWMLYGATGYTGRLVAELAVRRGHRPILAGRDPQKLAAMAVPLGLDYRTVDLRDTDRLEDGLGDVDVVAHCAGPFSSTAAPMVDACLRTRTHYLDITGEIEVFESVFARSSEAEQAGVVLLPGAGFDVVPTDCLAVMVAKRLPEADGLDLAFSAAGGISPGTLKSAWEGLAMGGRVREHGDLRNVPVGWRTRTVEFPSGTRTVTSLPWGDVATAYRSTGIETITTYAHLPGLDRFGSQGGRIAGKVFGHPLPQRLGKAAIGRFARGPGKTTRERSRVEVYAEAVDPKGRKVSTALVGPNTYDLTADAVVRIVDGLRSGSVSPGCHTPATAFGPDLVRELDGVRVIEPAGS